ncbi:MAG: penicillin acylase family protein [Gammaproteobacteria bacterium]|nr:penicillin acylase family protein [Gammaproteobacteria bacterium]
MKKQSIIVFFTLFVAAITATTTIGGPPRHPSGKDSVKIYRDNYGVPHVYGSTPRSLFYGVGYAQAQDRLWQAEIHRRLATGTLAEFFGPDSLEGDVFARTMFGPAERRVAQLETVTPRGRTILQAFADGMNAWIQEATDSGQLPVEYGALGLSVRPWTVDDSVATFMLLASQFGWFGSEELENGAHLQELVAIHGPVDGYAIFADTHWLDDPDAPTTIPDEGGRKPLHHGKKPYAKLPKAVPKAPSDFDRVLRGWKKNLRKAGIGEGPASNAVVLAPKLTTKKHALLLGGPQMGYSAPQINHEIGIHGAGFNITGTQIAGAPGVQIGVSREYAWTLTSGVSDNSDIYQETVINGQYLFNGELLAFDCRRETINVRGAGSVEVPVCESVHGPVIFEVDLPEPAPYDLAYTLKNSTNGLEMSSWEAWANLPRARSLHDFGKTLSAIAYNFNVLYADTRNNIAYWHIGKIPIRADGDDPWLPHDGSGGFEWQGYIPWKEMPHTRNPAQGWLASWNNKPVTGWENSVADFGTFGPVHRVNTLINLLEELTPRSATLATLEEINRTAGMTTDTPSGSARTVFVSTLLDDLIDHIELNPAADPKYNEIVELLEKWDWLQIDADQDGFYDQPAVAIFNTWWQKLVNRVFADDLGSTGQPNVVSNLLARLLDEDPAVPLLYNYLGGETIEQAVTQTFMETVDQLEPDNWLQEAAYIKWSRVVPLPFVDELETPWMNRGTYNQLVHLGKGRRLHGKNVVAPGQSGDPLSSHYADQLELYASWNYKPMILNRKDLKGHTEEVIHLKVP